MPWSIAPRDLLRHAYILGQTGTGKSALLQRLATAHIDAGAGLALLDPHGDLAEVLLDAIPRGRTDDLIYFNPAGDVERPLSINPLDGEVHDMRDDTILVSVQANPKRSECFQDLFSFRVASGFTFLCIHTRQLCSESETRDQGYG